MDAKALVRQLQAEVVTLTARVVKLESDAARKVDVPRIGPQETKPTGPSLVKGAPEGSSY